MFGNELRGTNIEAKSGKRHQQAGQCNDNVGLTNGSRRRQLSHNNPEYATDASGKYAIDREIHRAGRELILAVIHYSITVSTVLSGRHWNLGQRLSPILFDLRPHQLLLTLSLLHQRCEHGK